MIALRELPMFPLDTVLLPGSVLPLYLFEPRYTALYADILSGDRQFGVVLIERGRASGGEDSRFGVGTIAHMVGSATHDDGTISIVTVGTKRIEIIEWLEPDPYPRAAVSYLEDDPLSEIGLEFVVDARDQLARLKILFSELGADVGVDPPQLSEEPGAALYQMAQLAGLQSIDLQKVLEAESSDLRAGLVRDLIEDQVELVQLQLGIR
jgi:Lon protease-like protein